MAHCNTILQQMLTEIMLVAQDWGHVGNFEKQKGADNNSETNKTLKKLLEIAGLSIALPLDSLESGSPFITNAILWLKSELTPKDESILIISLPISPSSSLTISLHLRSSCKLNKKSIKY